MARSFQNRVENYLDFTFGSNNSTTPDTDTLTEYINDGVVCTVNAIIGVNPDEAMKFATSTEDTSDAGVTLTGQLLSVIREHDSTTILRPCEMIDTNDRYNASDVDSLHYRSKYNPAFYILNRKFHTIPASASGNNSSIVSQVGYSATESNPSDGDPLDYNSEGIKDFPNEYEHLVVLYVTALSAMARGNYFLKKLYDEVNDVNSLTIGFDWEDVEIPTFDPPDIGTYFEMPSLTFPNTLEDLDMASLPDFIEPDFGNFGDVDIPEFTFPSTLPDFQSPTLEYDLGNVRAKLNIEDIEMADKEFEVLSKNMEKFGKEMNVAKETYSNDSEIFVKQFEEEVKEYETKMDKAKSEFEKKFQEKLTEFQLEFEQRKIEYNTEWEKKVKEFDGDNAVQLKEFDAQVQINIADFQSQFQRAASNYKTYVDEEIAE